MKATEELHVFRIVQELMNNSIKHSGATVISLRVNCEENHVSLQYRDDGKGFDMEAMRKARGMGMRRNENRAEIQQTELDIASSHGNGISVN